MKSVSMAESYATMNADDVNNARKAAQAAGIRASAL